ncbi:MAG: helix-turn-helix transcriptional regulator [Chitinophagaceae bacterium]|nr:helix-turn-helix transcriptional regulator [Rubrivivax sp.]
MAMSPHAFIPLRKSVPGISDRMLTEQLSQLVDDHIVAQERDDIGHRYRLTPLGQSLIPVLQMLHHFGEALIDRRDGSTPIAVDQPHQDIGSPPRETAMRNGTAVDGAGSTGPSAQSTGNFAPAAR